MPVVEEIVLEIVHDEDLLRLRVGQQDHRPCHT